MKTFSTFLIFLSFLVMFSTSRDPFGDLELVHQIEKIQFNFETKEQREHYNNNKHYLNCTLRGLKYSTDGHLFVSLPRNEKENVPATLAILNETSLELTPFPNWEWNTVGTNLPNQTFYNILAFEIDEKNRLWVVDSGKTAEHEGAEHSVKLLVFQLKDLKKEKEEDRFTIEKYFFFENDDDDDDKKKKNEEGMIHEHSLLTEIVVNPQLGFAVIADSSEVFEGKLKPGLIIYNLEDNYGKRFLDSHPSFLPENDPETQQPIWLTVNGKKCKSQEPLVQGLNSLAFSCDFKRFYWSTLTSRRFYGIETDLLFMYYNHENEDFIKEGIVELSSNTHTAFNGFIMSDHKDLFFASVERNSIQRLDETELVPFVNLNVNVSTIANFSTLTKEYVYNGTEMFVWPDSFDFRENHLYVLTNNYCEFLENSEKENTVFIYKMKVNADKYVYGCREDFGLGLVEYIILGVGGGIYVLLIIIAIATQNLFWKKE